MYSDHDRVHAGAILVAVSSSTASIKPNSNPSLCRQTYSERLFRLLLSISDDGDRHIDSNQRACDARCAPGSVPLRLR